MAERPTDRPGHREVELQIIENLSVKKGEGVVNDGHHHHEEHLAVRTQILCHKTLISPTITRLLNIISRVNTKLLLDQ